MPDQAPKSKTRRNLLIGGGAAIAAGAAAAVHFKPWYRPLGANSDIRLGIAGLGGKGLDHTNHFADIPGCRITAICDPDPNQITRNFKDGPLKADAVTTYSDFRKLIEDKEVDAIVIASPNHWHALMGVWAMEAGKHVYVEKPIAHSIWEGQLLIDAAAKHQRIAQSGTQRRSDEAYHEAAAWLSEGHIGKITSAHAVVFRQRKAVTRRKTPTPMPAGIDYDHWCGPAPKEELYRSKLHYDWHWHWNTGNGELGNNGIHFLDVARIVLGESGLPNSATSIGGRLGWGDDAGETPNSHLTMFDYKVPLLAQIRNLPIGTGEKESKAMDNLSGIREGLVIHCEGGTLAWPKAKDSDGKTLKKFDSQDGHGHRVNWLKAIADDRPQDLNAPLTEGHISSALCHLGNASHRAGQTMPAEEITKAFKATPSASTALESLITHLGKNGIDLEKDQLTIGPPTGVEDANAKSTFRAPYKL
ncbi:MAG: putative dehydrogenase [Pseudoalteromonas tetraodonis]|jgi:predicted dehydrogenase